MINTFEICNRVLKRLSTMNYERTGGNFTERLIFPMKKNQAKGKVDRVSEQELRLLFIEEFLIETHDLFYSIETPTHLKYSFGKSHEDIKIAGELIKGQSALHDLSLFEKNKNGFKRILNIEFKHKNASLKSIVKDVLKLMHEEHNGVFILLLNNATDATLESVFRKLTGSFDTHKKNWRGGKDKVIEIIILSLEIDTRKKKVPFLMHYKISKSDLNTKTIFSSKNKSMLSI